MKKQYWNVDRTAAMKYLRQCGLNDVQIGDFMGLSRERVAQLIGRVGKDPGAMAREKAELDRVVTMLEIGKTMADIERETGNCNIFTWMKSRGLRYTDYAGARLERKKFEVKSDLSKMMQSGLRLNASDMQRYSMELYHRAVRVMGLRQWREYFGAE